MKLTSAKPREVIRVLERVGFQLVRQSGSHATFRHPVSEEEWTKPNIEQAIAEAYLALSS